MTGESDDEPTADKWLSFYKNDYNQNDITVKDKTQKQLLVKDPSKAQEESNEKEADSLNLSMKELKQENLDFVHQLPKSKGLCLDLEFSGM